MESLIGLLAIESLLKLSFVPLTPRNRLRDTGIHVTHRGSRARLMSHVKDYVRHAHDVRHFLTYADNYAIGYFKKQGFTTEISLEKSIWMGYIKDYEGFFLL